MSDLATLKKRRGVAKASITRLTHRLEELESDPEKSTALDLARGMARKLETLDSDFRTQHHALIDLVNDEDTLIAEQGTLDNHDDFVAELSARIQHLISACAPSSDQSTRKVALKRLSRLQKSLTSIQGAIPSDEGSATDVCLLQQYEEELAHHKSLHKMLFCQSTSMMTTNSLYYKETSKERFSIYPCRIRNSYTLQQARLSHLPLIRLVRE